MSISLFLSSLLTLVSLNCENLFDCRHDSLKNDYEWLPEGSNGAIFLRKILENRQKSQKNRLGNCPTSWLCRKLKTTRF